ncbi:MAG TPA: RagB/SusD family nutrient uptake outer membrane protein, partial [Bacteroidales bacterium]|nr:RagB/SusD family nutrient uptake outer membrane protein [Bacteroidales bacterium]
IRAWAYRHLTFGWGDVPLALEQSSGSTIKTDWERTPVSQVREQIVKDLLEAEPYIGVEPSLRGRISKGAVQHYLAEMYLTLGNPTKALEWADKVINTPQYKLVTQRYGIKKSKPGVPFMDMFLDGNSNREEGNTEALWVFQFGLKVTGGGSCMIRRIHLSRFWNISVNGVRPIVHTFDRGGLGYSRFTFTKWALDNYEKTDYRFSPYAIRKYYILGDAATNAPYPADNLPAGYHYGDTIKCKWDPDITYTTRARFDWPYSRKAEGVNPENMNEQYMNNDQVYLRLADTYLLKAEAEFKLGLLQDAANTLNIIRRRSNASEITSAQVNLDFILDERSRELFLEEHRRWTLLRTHKFLERTMAYNKNGGQNLSARDTIYPIPQSVIDANLTKEMPQNPGY